MVAEILLAIALKITEQIVRELLANCHHLRMNISLVWVVFSWTPERAMTELDAFPSNRPVEAVTSAVRVQRGLISQDLALSIFL